MKQVKTKATKNKGSKSKYIGNKRPIYVCSTIMGLVAATFIGLFTWKLITNKNGTGEGTKTKISINKKIQELIKLDNKEIIIGEDYKSNMTFFGKEDQKYIFEESVTIKCLGKTLELDKDFFLDLTPTNVVSNDELNYVLLINGDAIKGAIRIEEIKATPNKPVQFMTPPLMPKLIKADFIPRKTYAEYSEKPYVGRMFFKDKVGDIKPDDIDIILDNGISIDYETDFTIELKLEEREGMLIFNDSGMKKITNEVTIINVYIHKI